LACAKQECATPIGECTGDSECMKSLTCAVKTCDVAGLKKDGIEGQLKDCVTACFQGASGLQQKGIDAYNCATGTCGSACQSLVGSL